MLCKTQTRPPDQRRFTQFVLYRQKVGGMRCCVETCPQGKLKVTQLLQTRRH